MATLKGIFPNPKPPRKKNYVQANMKSLREMEKYFHSNKEVEKLKKLQIEKQQHNKYENIRARVNSSLRGSSSMSGDNNYVNNHCRDNVEHTVNRKSSAPISMEGVEAVKHNNNNSNNINNNNNNSRHQPILAIDLKQKKGSRPKPDLQNTNRSLPDALNLMHINQNFDSSCESSGKAKFTDRYSQTMNTTNLDEICSEGVIRYASSKGQRQSPVLGKGHKRMNLNVTTDRGDSNKHSDSFGPKENINYVEANKDISVAARMAAQMNNGVLPPNYRKGVLPKYLVERKEEQLHQQTEKAKMEAANADCPPGHVPLPDNERKETLRMLKKNYEGLVNELNKLPIRSDTLRSQRRKMDLEQQLKKLEEGIKVFSRPKVFIKTNE